MYNYIFLYPFSIGLKNSPDLIHAKKVATFIQSDHTEVIVSEEDMLNSMEQVIYHLETFDITTKELMNYTSLAKS